MTDLLISRESPPRARVRLALTGLWGAAATVGGLTAASKIVSLLKDSIVAARFGNGADLDALLLALALPTFMINVIAGTLPAALTPSYIALRERSGIANARLLAAVVLRRVYVVLAVLSVFGVLASVGFLWLPGAQIAPATRALLPWLALLLAPYTFLQGVCAAWVGLLAAENRFAIGALAPVAQPVCMVAAVLLFGGDAGIVTVAGGLMVGTLVQGAALHRAMQRCGIATRWARIAPAEQSAVRAPVHAVRGQYLPAVAGALLMSATGIIDQSMAAWLPPGSVSALGMGTKLSALVMSVGAMALSTTLLPHLSSLVARQDWNALRSLLRRVSMLILGITIPATAAMIAGSAPIAAALYDRGAFTAADTRLVAQVQSAYLLQLPVHLLGILYVRLISALRANRLLTISAAMCLVVNVALNVVFMRWIGVAGIALSTAVVYLVSCTFLGVSAHRCLERAARATKPQDLAQVGHGTIDDAGRPCASAA